MHAIQYGKCIVGRRGRKGSFPQGPWCCSQQQAHDDGSYHPLIAQGADGPLLQRIPTGQETLKACSSSSYALRSHCLQPRELHLVARATTVATMLWDMVAHWLR